MAVFQTTDLTAASYSVAMYGLAATSVLLLIGTGWVGRGWKVPVTLCAVAALVGLGAAYDARAAWATDGSVPIVYHYVGWSVSMPLQVIALYFYAYQMGKVGLGLFWRLVIVAVLMVFVRYLGEAGFMHPTLAFLIGLIFWLYILGELFFGRMDEVIRNSDVRSVQRCYFWLRLIVTVGWAIYPLGNFITSFGGYVDNGALSVTYNLADIPNVMAFGLAVLVAALGTSEATGHA
jgi:hypothetical protein